MDRHSCLVVAFVILLEFQSGCLSQSCGNDELIAYDYRCEEMAAYYRTGQPEKLDFQEMSDYFRRRLGMPVSELKAMLGEPLVVQPDHMYYTYALNKLYHSDELDEPGFRLGKDYDRVLLYSEKGPPDHWIPDASCNLFFIIKVERVVAMRELFP